VDRRLEFHRRADRARRENCAGDFAAASLFVDPPAGRNGNTPYCEKQGIGVIVYSPMASGLLTGAMTRDRAAKLPDGDWRKHSPEFREPNLSENLKLVERLKNVAARYGRSPGEVAIAWPLRLPAVTGAIVGARNATQAEGVMRAGELKLTPQDIAEIEGTAAAHAGR
jgi:aryl-alcohol dehydrogenase-like predicted oxidoreductase